MTVSEPGHDQAVQAPHAPPPHAPDQPDAAPAQNIADRGVAGPAAEIFDRLSSRLGGSATVRAVYGEPIERGGVVIIPVARVSIGFGGGGGKGRNKDGESGEGAGGGGGASATPVGYIEIKNGDAVFKPIRDPLTDVLVPAGALLAGTSVATLIRRILKRRR